MSQSGPGNDGFPADDLPILGSFQDGASEAGSWRTGFSSYVSLMRRLVPEEDHPTDEWLQKGVSLLSLEQDQGVTTQDKQGAAGSGGEGSGGTAQASSGSQATMPVHLDVATSGVAGFKSNPKRAASSQRVKDRHFRVQSFANKAVQIHAGDLFDIQMSTQELAKLVEGVAPYLASTVCQATTSSSGASGAATPVVTPPQTFGEIISPLLTKIGRLHTLVDNRVHLQQSASSSSIGYNAFYAHKNSLPQGLRCYGEHARASVGFLAQDRSETEAAVRHSKARQKLLSAEHKRRDKSAVVDSARSFGKDGNSRSRASRRRYNKRQRELYQKRKKAKRAIESAAQTDEAVTDASLAPSVPME